VNATVVTPWLNHRELERDYWQALRHVDAEVIVVDNGSQPPLPNAWRLPTNTGFAHASNTGLQLARTDAVVFLNNDIAAVGDWLTPLLAHLEPGVLVGPELRTDPHGAVDGEPLPYLDGWCLAGLTSELLELGGWDEGYQEPSYYGDNDLSLRARSDGFALRETRDVRSVLVHKRNATSGGGANADVRAATDANRARFVARAQKLLA
jgi:GT2 family glycosyltransferase